jgi:ubiquinone/menaquinone biosynthesis C-methylase UbiE
VEDRVKSVITNVVFASCLLSLGFSQTILANEFDDPARVLSLILCEKYLSMEGQTLATAKPYSDKIPEFLKLIRAVTPPNILPFKVHSFNPDEKVGEESFVAIVMQILNPNSALKHELDHYVETLGGRNDPALWAAYLQSYGRIVPFSNSYLEEMAAIDEILPEEGTFIDNGAGQGIMTAFMALNRPKRRMIATDYEPESVAIAKQRLAYFTDGDFARFDAQILDVTKNHLPRNSADGGYTHNVIYLLGDRKQQAINNMVAPLKPGSPFIYIDVADTPREKQQKALMDIAFSSIRNGSPANMFDFALVGYVNLYILLAERQDHHSFLSTDAEQRAMLKAAGLEVHGVFESYGGSSMMYYTTKERPERGSPSSKSGSQ